MKGMRLCKMDCVVQQALHGKVGDGVEEGQEGGRVQRLAA